jgi:uncharacterized membrane protein
VFITGVLKLKNTLLKRLLTGACLTLAACTLMAQTGSPAGTPKPAVTPAEVSPNPLLALPEALVQALELLPKQQAMLDEVYLARRQMWSALRNARQAEYAAMTKELEKEKFDPREVIAIRKKIRQAADKRLDEVQAGWLAFWDTLSAEQSKRLVQYMKQQHLQQGNASPGKPSVMAPVVR